MVKFVMSRRLDSNKDTDKVSIQQVNDWLDLLSRKQKKEHRPERDKVFKTMMLTMNGEMHYWMAKIILRDLKLGFGAQMVLNCFHQDANAYYDSCTDLGKAIT